jgi:hypothetical protein
MIRQRRDGQPGGAHLGGDAPPAAFERLFEVDERALAIDRQLDGAHAQLGRL